MCLKFFKSNQLHEGGILDLFIDILVLIEGEGAGEGHVDDHPGAPHVQRPDGGREVVVINTFRI